MAFADIYRRRRVLVTGHTGFKGSWLALWLSELGAEVTGLGLAPATSPNHWDLLGLKCINKRCDIRDAASTAAVVKQAAPEIVFHLAAQALVRRSYRDPLETWSTNVVGTAVVLEAIRQVPGIRAVVVVTTDKCYENREWEWGYRETDRLGGRDPYSASKAGAELVVASYRDAFCGGQDAPLLASARAGNVIGGGDWSEDRLLPDLVRAVADERSLQIRAPAAMRPWQHVLEPLAGYLCLGQRLWLGQREFAQAWNFGPAHESNVPVQGVLERLRSHWPALRWHLAEQPGPQEAELLCLDSSKARSKLHWSPAWSLDVALRATAEWYQAYLERGEVTSREQLHEYMGAARQNKIDWAGS